jgi:hypothetical protein
MIESVIILNIATSVENMTTNTSHRVLVDDKIEKLSSDIGSNLPSTGRTFADNC